jgi:UDPglucose 6-dehydrogenase
MTMKVGVIGAGHVGLVAAAAFAELGHSVICTDTDEEKIRMLERRVAPFHEPGLDELIRSTTETGRLAFTSDSATAVRDADVVFVCVGTPARSTGEANLVAVERAVRATASHARDGLVLVQKSTVPAGTSARVEQALRIELGASGRRIHVVSNPEFLREGRAIEDSLNPDRILVGSDSPEAFATMRALYRPLIDAGCIYIETDVRTAELAKHASNAFLALKISYVNALARICELAGADVVDVAGLMGSDPRIGRSFLDAGLGYGGFCFPKDIQAFDRLAGSLGYDFPLLREIARINDESVVATFEKIRDGLWNLEDKTIALLGLSFKPGTDDVRFSPALALGQRLIEAGATVIGFDPQAGSNAKEDLPDLEIASDPYDAASGAHCVVLCTEWAEFKVLDLERLRRVMAFPMLVDGRNFFDQATAYAAGFDYLPTGRASVTRPPARDAEGGSVA